MSTEQGGTATWHSTITCPEDGEALNENALVTELAIPIIDRTKYLKEQLEGGLQVVQAWAHLTTDGAGGVVTNDGVNVASAAIVGNHVRLTLTDAMSTAYYGGSVTVETVGKAGLGYPNSTTTFDAYSITTSTGTAEDLGTTARTLFVLVLGRLA